MSSFSLSFNEAAFAAQLDAQATAVEEATRPAAQAMAQVLVDAVRANVARIPKKTGRLAESIYQAYSKDNSTPVHAVYHISWNARKAPHGHLIEFGHVQRYQIVYDEKTGKFYTRKDRPLPEPKHIPAQPFVRPAEALIPQAQQAGLDRFYEVLRKQGVFK